MTEDLSPDNLTRNDKIALLWGFMWRGVVITLGSCACGFIIGAIVGAFVGVICAVFGVGASQAKLAIQIACFPFGLAVGVWFFWLWLRWIFRARFGQYRLRLVRADETSAAA